MKRPMVNNYFQKGINITQEEINHKAQQEFDALVDKLQKVGVKVIQVEDIYEMILQIQYFLTIGLVFIIMEM